MFVKNDIPPVLKELMTAFVTFNQPVDNDNWEHKEFEDFAYTSEYNSKTVYIGVAASRNPNSILITVKVVIKNAIAGLKVKELMSNTAADEFNSELTVSLGEALMVTVAMLEKKYSVKAKLNLDNLSLN